MHWWKRERERAYSGASGGEWKSIVEGCVDFSLGRKEDGRNAGG